MGPCQDLSGNGLARILEGDCSSATRIGDFLDRGDVDAESASDNAGALTPMPGRVGPVTMALLLRHTVQALPGRRDPRPDQGAFHQYVLARPRVSSGSTFSPGRGVIQQLCGIPGRLAAVDAISGKHSDGTPPPMSSCLMGERRTTNGE